MSIAAQVVILFLVVLVGVLCRRLGYFTDETIRGVTQLVVNVTLPVLTVYNMQRPFDMHVLMNFLLTLLLSLAAILASIGGASLLFRHRPHDKRAVLLNMAGFSNCGFMGYPIILAINPDWMIYAVAYNIAYLLVSWTVGVSLFQGRQNVSLKRVLLNPNVIAAFLGFAVFCLNIMLPHVVLLATELLLIGTRISGIRLSELRDKDYHITAALRLIVLPLILYVLLLPLHLDPAVWSTLYLLTAMPCGTLSAMQAELYGGDARFAARAIAYSTLLSLVTVPLISMLL